AGNYKTTSILKLTNSNTKVYGLGAASQILFQPTDWTNQDRAISIANSDGFSGVRTITTPITVGLTNFTSSGTVNDLVNGDWIIVQETDSGVGGEIVII